jgi:CheY-like chemotaxis protein
MSIGKYEVSMNENEIKEVIQKHLRTADEYCSLRNYDSALSEIGKVLSYDPRNQLARSFAEKIKLIQKQREEPVQQIGSSREFTGEQKMKALPKLFQEIQHAMGRKDFHLATEKIKAVYAIDPANFYAKAYAEKINEMKRSSVEERTQILQQPPPKSANDPTDLSKGSVHMYRELLKEFWFDGKISQDEETELKTIRDMFGITLDEHNSIEREVKVQSYIDALQSAWKDKDVTGNEQRFLELMRQRFSISIEEHRAAESKIEVARKTKVSRGAILIVDHKESDVAELTEQLKNQNFDTFVAKSIDEALGILVKRVPIVIICEMFIGEKGIDGFALHKKLQSNSTFKDIPFFLTTSLQNDKIGRAALRTGIDNLFYKPIDYKWLLIEIERKAGIQKK